MIPGIVAGRPYSPLWTPSDLAIPPKLWLNDQSPVIDVSGFASQWDDISGSGWDFTQGTAANRPAIVSSGLNGRRTIRGDGTNDDMSNSASALLYRNVSAGWAFIVCQRTVSTGGGANRLLFQTFANLGNTRFRILADSTTNADKVSLQVRRLDADAIATLAGTVAVNSGPHMILCTMDWGSGAGSIYVDGSLDVTNGSLTSAGSTSNTSGNPPHIFSSGAGTAYYDGDIAELVATSGSSLLSATEIDKLFGYAAHRWGLTSLLPALHPYKTSPP